MNDKKTILLLNIVKSKICIPLHLFNLMYSFKISFYRVHPSMGAEK